MNLRSLMAQWIVTAVCVGVVSYLWTKDKA